MLRILLGVDWKENRRQLLTQICARAADGLQGQVVIVPDQFSHEMERALCEAGGDEICRYAEVLSFSRLANRVFSVCGGIAEQPMDHGGRLMAIAAAVDQVRSRLKLYGNCGERPEFLLQLLDTLDECKAYCVTPEALRHAAEGTGGVLAVKLEELALLSESYDAVCANGAQDTASRLMKLQQCLARCGYAEDKTFYFEGFTDFNGLELQILAELLGAGAEVTVTLLCDGMHDGQNVFDCVRRTAKALVNIANRQNDIVQVREAVPGAGEAELTHLRKWLFAGRMPEYDGACEAVSLCAAQDVYDEAVIAAGEILRLVQSGCRWRDISVACGDMTRYRPVLQAVFGRYGIPAYFSGTDNLLGKPVVQTVLFALEAATGGMEQESVFSYLKSGLPPLERDRCDRLENYAIVWNISGSGWKKPWSMHPDGYGGELDESAMAALEALNRDRESAIGPLLHLQKRLAEAENTAQQVLALYDFLEEIGFARRLNEIADGLAAEGQLQQAQEYAQLYQIITGAMEQFYSVLGKTVRSGEQFARLIRALLSQYNVGTIPAAMDSVCVGSVPSMRRSQTKYLFVMGACEGIFPACAGETGLFSAEDRRRLQELGVTVAPGSPERLERELHGIYNVLTAPEKRLYVSAVAGAEAYLFRRLERLFPHAGKTPEPIPEIVYRSPEAALEYLAQTRENTPPEAERLAQCLPKGDIACKRLFRQADFTPGGLTRQTVKGLYGNTLYLSASRIDLFAQCRYAYFLSYGLKAKERKQAAFDAPIYGTLVHFVLEHTARQICREGGFHNVSGQRALELAQQAVDEFTRVNLPDLQDKPERFTYLYERNLQEIMEIVQDMVQELKLSDFEPEGFELEFSKTGEMDAVHIVGKQAESEISGYVDRVDIYRRGEQAYVRVVDYKTGRKNFDYTDLLNGLGLQMLIYLFALENSGEKRFGVRLEPGGVLYFPARCTTISASQKVDAEEAAAMHQKERRRKGLLLDNTAVLHAMEPSDHPVYLPYDCSRDGKRKGDLASGGQMERLKAFVYRQLEQITDDIASGNVTPEPYYRGSAHDACSYCPYGAVCHADAGCVQRRVRARVTRDEFWKEVEAGNGG